jgi:hypothetical protein
MAEYTDIPQINDLYTEQQLVQTAIYNLETNGAIINMTVAPSTNPTMPVVTPLDPTMVPPAEVPKSTVSVIINLKQPNSPELLAGAITALKSRDDEITQELAALGVVNTPVKR